jgi:hypothetical protein
MVAKTRALMASRSTPGRRRAETIAKAMPAAFARSTRAQKNSAFPPSSDIPLEVLGAALEREGILGVLDEAALHGAEFALAQPEQLAFGVMQ